MHLGCELLSSVWANQNYWQELNIIQLVSPSEPLMKHVSSLWVPSLCLSRSEPLTRRAEHVLRVWVPPAFQEIRTIEIRTIDKNDWTHVQLVSHSHVWASKLLTRTAEHVSKMWVLSSSVQLFSKIYDQTSYAVNRVETLMWKCMKFEGQGKKRETLVCWSYCGQFFNF